MLDEDDADVSGLSVEQNDGNNEIDVMHILTIEEHLTFTWENRGWLKKDWQ